MIKELMKSLLMMLR